MNIAVFVSGRGSNLKAIIDSAELKECIKIGAVFSDKSDCSAFELAKAQDIPVFSIGSKEGFIPYAELPGILRSYNIDLIVLAGFLKLIPPYIVEEYNSRIINIHPALLPSFGGSGMYGMNVHRAVFDSSAQVSGATVHFVDQNYDTGSIIAQRCVDISGVNSPEEIAERVLTVEHVLLPYVIKKLADKKIRRSGKRVLIDD